nr:immunoglobulin heavy chain junction region [Macaca mulatta]MPN83954.1 immunoglobulin heavy chain junction region [Macaca mulatta]MPN84028.1 immunoglobulin heavy chain junction region [Macaca mulatta]MPN84142.1 immunoglobulin heavy chain junction region [Macaca mulatta]MPN84146.1 immunoglobulin heavy chain junction region [Macaca mulatta]
CARDSYSIWSGGLDYW